jgi:EC042_2821-lke REase/Protein of unknown function (DUF3644)
MAKRKMVQVSLIKNSIAAYFATIEIHNKPNISYRYETVTLLMMNAWELALKAYVKKYIKNRSIFIEKGYTISVDNALDYVNEHRNSIKSNSFTAIKKNIEEIEAYRNGITHFYCEQLEPYIFMLIARSALNYVDFMKSQFSKDVMVDEGLFIMPLGFKLPFKPEDFLSNRAAKYAASEETKAFIQEIVTVIKSLQEEGIEDSIVLGFGIFFESLKKASNSDILAAITTLDNADATFAKATNVKLSNDPNAKILNMSDQEFRATWKYSHAELLSWCKENVSSFKQGIIFNNMKKKIKGDINYVYTRRLDNKNPRSASQDFYTDSALQKFKNEYEKEAASGM